MITELTYYNDSEGETEYPITKYKTWIKRYDDFPWTKLGKPSLNEQSQEALDYYDTSNAEDKDFLEKELNALKDDVNKELRDIDRSEVANKELRQKPLLDEAKKKFPVGTEFTSLFGAKDTIKSHDGTFRVDEFNEVFVKCNMERLIYDGNSWADKIEI